MAGQYSNLQFFGVLQGNVPQPSFKRRLNRYLISKVVD